MERKLRDYWKKDQQKRFSIVKTELTQAERDKRRQKGLEHFAEFENLNQGVVDKDHMAPCKKWYIWNAPKEKWPKGVTEAEVAEMKREHERKMAQERKEKQNAQEKMEQET